LDVRTRVRSWIAADEPPACTVVNREGASRIVLACDHASARLPRRLGTLGLDPGLLDDHIAWDVGSAGVARALSERLDAPLVLAGYSRLVVDNNRPLTAPDAFVEQSEGKAVPGNQSLTEAERNARAAVFFWPYHDAIHDVICAKAKHTVPVLVSMHSFTPVYHGIKRPWDVGVLHRRDGRGANLALAHLRADPSLVVGDNKPYRIDLDGDYTVPVHAETRGLPYVMLEIRQDHIDSPVGIADWARRITALLEEALSHRDLSHYRDGATDCQEPRYGAFDTTAHIGDGRNR
jgi:predicted N-formylglutamate amidohydrolase